LSPAEAESARRKETAAAASRMRTRVLLNDAAVSTS
jgi:hypothetical protein